MMRRIGGQRPLSRDLGGQVVQIGRQIEPGGQGCAPDLAAKPEGDRIERLIMGHAGHRIAEEIPRGILVIGRRVGGDQAGQKRLTRAVMGQEPQDRPAGARRVFVAIGDLDPEAEILLHGDHPK